MAKNRVLYGLTNVHYSVITRNEDGTYTYAKPVRIEGAVSLEMSPTGDPMNFYADNGIFFSRNSNTGYEGTLTIAMVTDQFRTDVLGEKMVNGGFLEASDAKAKDIALLFEVDGDVQATRFVYYDVTVARPSQSAATVAESIEIEGQELTFTAKPRTSDKAIRWNTGEATDKAIYDAFYDAVVEPVDTTTPVTP
ncbi:major tail protein [Lysinibacillus capsici]|uniref:major tail protein n=1 Tax=Lysinibacillus capsici TaxID=2115968 RepID=UPI000E204DEF|nr:major tail protein [Lysinibacillus capsici]RDV27119.1 phage tail protein [Lysinibacillus capsici]